MPLYQDWVSVINAIRSNEGEKSLYQGNKLMNYSREKRYFQDHAAHIVQSIIDCFKRRHGKPERKGNMG